jgi:hypothetical protein
MKIKRFALITCIFVALATSACGTNQIDNRTSSVDPQSQLSKAEALGTPASPSVRREVVGVLRGYGAAVAVDDGRKACQFLYGPVADQLPPPAGRAAGSGCATALAALFAGQPPGARRALARLRVGSVVLARNQAFAFVINPDGGAGFYPLDREGGHWRLAAIGVSRLSGANLP